MSLGNLPPANMLTGMGESYDLETSSMVRHIAGRGLHDPNSLTPYEVQQLCGSVMRHLEKRNNALANALRDYKPPV